MINRPYDTFNFEISILIFNFENNLIQKLYKLQLNWKNGVISAPSFFLYKEYLHFRGIYMAAVKLKDGKECIMVKEGLFREYSKDS